MHLYCIVLHQCWPHPPTAARSFHPQVRATFCLCVFAGGGKAPPKLTVQPSATNITIRHTGYAPVLHRSWSHSIDAAAGVSIWVVSDGQLLVIKVYKAQPGRMWTTCFKVNHGTSHYRHLLLKPLQHAPPPPKHTPPPSPQAPHPVANKRQVPVE
jgi:hypothetical protein